MQDRICYSHSPALLCYYALPTDQEKSRSFSLLLIKLVELHLTELGCNIGLFFSFCVEYLQNHRYSIKVAAVESAVW